MISSSSVRRRTGTKSHVKGFNNMEEYEEWLETIEDMVESGEYEWAEETLLDIGETIEDNEHVTNGQIEAIENMRYA